MTCIVGILDKKTSRVIIGGDSAGVGGYDVTIRKDVKVFKVGGFVIGCTSSFRMIQLLRFSFNPPKPHPTEDIYRFMCTSFIDAMRDCFRRGGFLEVDKNVEFGGTFLVGYRDRLFCIMNDLQVAESANGYDSCGCGQSYALGALRAQDSNRNMDPQAKLLRALEIATHFSAGVRPPFVFEQTDEG